MDIFEENGQFFKDGFFYLSTLVLYLLFIQGPLFAMIMFKILGVMLILGALFAMVYPPYAAYKHAKHIKGTGVNTVSFFFVKLFRFASLTLGIPFLLLILLMTFVF